jgi:hypothetical protein
VAAFADLYNREWLIEEERPRHPERDLPTLACADRARRVIVNPAVQGTGCASLVVLRSITEGRR